MSRYFVIPGFNPTYNLEKLQNLYVSKISTIHSRYLEKQLCFLLLYTNEKCLELDVTNSFKPLSTSKEIVKVEEREATSTRLFFLSTFPPHTHIDGIKKLLNTFSRGNYKVFPGNGNPKNCIYWQIDFKNIILATHAINFIPNIDFSGSPKFISSNPFDIPLIQFTGVGSIQRYISSKDEISDFNIYYINQSLLTPKRKFSFVLTDNIETAQIIISETNHDADSDQIIYAQNYLNQQTINYLLFYKVKVEISNSFSDIKDFMFQMSEFGPIYQVFEQDDDDENYYVIFQDRKSLRNLFKSKTYSVSLPDYSIFTLYNFPPKTTIEAFEKYIKQAQISYDFIEKCDEKRNILPHFRIFVTQSEEEKITSFFNSPNCIFNNKTRPFCVRFLYEHEFELKSNSFINSNYTLQLPSEPTKTITDVFNEYSRFGIINLLFYDNDIRRYSVTYNETRQFSNAKKHLDSSYPQQKTIIVQKEKTSVILQKDKKGDADEKNPIQIQIKRRSSINFNFLFSSDDDDDNNNQLHPESGDCQSSLPQAITFNLPIYSSKNPVNNMNGTKTKVNKDSDNLNPFCLFQNNTYDANDFDDDDEELNEGNILNMIPRKPQKQISKTYQGPLKKNKNSKNDSNQSLYLSGMNQKYKTATRNSGNNIFKGKKMKEMQQIKNTNKKTNVNKKIVLPTEEEEEEESFFQQQLPTITIPSAQSNLNYNSNQEENKKTNRRSNKKTKESTEKMDEKLTVQKKTNKNPYQKMNKAKKAIIETDDDDEEPIFYNKPMSNPYQRRNVKKKTTTEAENNDRSIQKGSMNNPYQTKYKRQKEIIESDEDDEEPIFYNKPMSNPYQRRNVKKKPTIKSNQTKKTPEKSKKNSYQSKNNQNTTNSKIATTFNDTEYDDDDDSENNVYFNQSAFTIDSDNENKKPTKAGSNNSKNYKHNIYQLKNKNDEVKEEDDDNFDDDDDGNFDDDDDDDLDSDIDDEDDDYDVNDFDN